MRTSVGHRRRAPSFRLQCRREVEPQRRFLAVIRQLEHGEDRGDLGAMCRS